MNQDLRILFDEHEIIVEAIALAEKAGNFLGKDNEKYEDIIRQMITFFRNYADKFHHYKEEEILFPEMNKKNELLQTGIIKEMLDNHSDFRDMIAAIVKSLDSKEYEEADKTLHQYTTALLDHIAVENEEVFQMAETLFSERELSILKFRFDDCDRQLGNENKNGLFEMLNTVRKNFI